MTMLSFFRRAKCRHSDDKAMDELSPLVEQTGGGLSEQQRIDGAAKIIGSDDPTVDEIERLGELLNGLSRS